MESDQPNKPSVPAKAKLERGKRITKTHEARKAAREAHKEAVQAIANAPVPTPKQALSVTPSKMPRDVYTLNEMGENHARVDSLYPGGKKFVIKGPPRYTKN